MISICIPTFNRVHYLRTALDSCLRQEGAPIHEIIVSDNASTDGTGEMVRQFAAKSPIPVIYFSNTSNRGGVRNFIEAISRTNGRYINMLCSDDVFPRGSIAEKYKVVEGTSYDPLCVMVGSDTIVTSHQLGPIGWGLSPPGRLRGADIVRLSCNAKVNFFGNPGNLLINGSLARGCVESIDSGYRYLADFNFYANIMASRSGSYYINCCRPGLLYRVHDEMDTKVTCSDDGLRSVEWKRIADEVGIDSDFKAKFTSHSFWLLQLRKMSYANKSNWPVSLKRI